MADFDRNKASIARVYDYVLGGKDNFAADRAVGDRILSLAPELAAVVRENKEMLARAVTWVAEQGISQFIDLGCGLPTEPSTQQCAQAVAPDARVAYVDNDPVVLSHLQARLYQDPAALILDLDLEDADAVRRSVDGFIDFSRPVCLLMGSLLHFYDHAEARDLVARHAAALPPGSHIVLTTVAVTPGPNVDQAIAVYSEGAHAFYPHTAEELTEYFGKAELVAPGVADARTWRPGWDTVPEAEPRGVWMYGGIACKTA
ncbi:MAG: SAM-dependent methyltransferase [Streptosporangiales bacterium]|nr:SAM-dependent methyltransferase [Streptosporangiales bacterium]